MSTTIEPPPEVVLVRSADSMDRETFCLHMTHRHADSLGGMRELSPFRMDPALERSWRIFHDRLHDVRIDLDHDHER